MLRPEHSYLVVNGVAELNAIIQESKGSKPLRVILEYAPNHPVTHSNGFMPEQVFSGPNKQVTIFVKRQISPLQKIARWPHGSIFCCPICGTETDMTGKP